MSKGIGVTEKCWICDNTRELTEDIINSVWVGPWICDECKQAIIWAKEAKKQKEGEQE